MSGVGQTIQVDSTELKYDRVLPNGVNVVIDNIRFDWRSGFEYLDRIRCHKDIRIAEPSRYLHIELGQVLAL